MRPHKKVTSFVRHQTILPHCSVPPAVLAYSIRSVLEYSLSLRTPVSPPVGKKRAALNSAAQRASALPRYRSTLNLAFRGLATRLSIILIPHMPVFISCGVVYINSTNIASERNIKITGRRPIVKLKKWTLGRS